MAGDFKPANEKNNKLKWVFKLEVMKNPKIFTPKFHHLLVEKGTILAIWLRLYIF
jgi:hypothetical protein